MIDSHSLTHTHIHTHILFYFKCEGNITKTTSDLLRKLAVPEVRAWARLWAFKTHMKHHFDFNPHVRRGFERRAAHQVADKPDVQVSVSRSGTDEFGIKLYFTSMIQLWNAQVLQRPQNGNV